MTEFVLVLPVCMLLFAGIAQFALICVNAIMIKYAAFSVARCAISYIEPFKSDELAQMSNKLVKTMMTYANFPGSKMDDIYNMRIKHDVTDPSLEIERNIKFKNSNSLYTRITVSYFMPLRVPVASAFFGSLPGSRKENGRYYFPLKGTAIMNSGVLK